MRQLDTKTQKHDIRGTKGSSMKNVTITLDDGLAIRARVEAAGQGKSLSKFVGELIEREIGRKDSVDLKTIDEFFYGPGYPGVSKNWRGREALYAEREDELLRRHQRAGLHDRSQRRGKESSRPRTGEERDGETNARPKSPKLK
jgi:hypothetical protein